MNQNIRKITRRLLEIYYERGGFYKGKLSDIEKLAINKRFAELDSAVKKADQTVNGRWEDWEAEQKAIEALLKPAM